MNLVKYNNFLKYLNVFPPLKMGFYILNNKDPQIIKTHKKTRFKEMILPH